MTASAENPPTYIESIYKWLTSNNDSDSDRVTRDRHSEQSVSDGKIKSNIQSSKYCEKAG